MQPINKKPVETPENNFYGVDVNNRMAVEQEFTKLQGQHRMVTIVVIVLLLAVIHQKKALIKHLNIKQLTLSRNHLILI